jgi:RNA polymerase sigma-70 factor (ECF subfamily)
MLDRKAQEGHPPVDDAALVERCRAGEPEAFEALVERYQASLLAVTWSLIGNREDALDATQEAFLSAFSNLGGFDAGRSFKSWLFAIAWKRGLDMKRKQRTGRKYLRLFGRSGALAADSIPARPNRLEDSEIFSPVLRKLGPRERLALCLRMNEGYTAAEIAEVLGCAEGSARVYVFNAVRRVRELWNKGKGDV